MRWLIPDKANAKWLVEAGASVRLHTDNCRTIKREKHEPITRQLLYLILFVPEIRPPVYLALRPTSLSFQ